MTDLISRQAAIDVLRAASSLHGSYVGAGTRIAIERITELPNARLDAGDIRRLLFNYFSAFHKEFPSRDEKEFVADIVEKAHDDWREAQRVEAMRSVHIDIGTEEA